MRTNIIITIVSFLVINFAFGQDYSSDKKKLLSIGDEQITVAEFMRVYQKNNIQNEVIDKKSLEEYLELFINFKLKVKEAEDLGLDTNKSFVDELGGYRKQLTKPYFIDDNVNQQLVEEAYKRKLIDIRASHILIKLQESASPEDTLRAYKKIEGIRERIMQGDNFEELAVEFSDDPSARDMEAVPGQRPFRKGNQGDLGYFTVFDMLYPFENGAYNTKTGDVSEIIRTRFGYHIIKVTDKKDAMGKATVAHVYAAMPKGSGHSDSVKIEKKILQAQKEIQNGADFDAVVLKYSDDRGSKEKGGVLPPFGVNRMVPEFISEIASLNEPGQISGPVLTQYGWHLIKLVEQEKPGTFEEEEETLKERIQRDSRSHKSRDAVIIKVKKDYKFKEYPQNLEAVTALVDSSILDKKWKSDTAAHLIKPLFKFGKEKYSQADFAEYMAKKQLKNRETNIDVFVRKSYEEFIDDMCIDYLDLKLEKIYPDFGALMKEYRDGILLFELTDQKVWSKAVKDTTGLEEFYNKNKNNYLWDQRAKATIYTVLDKNKLDDVRNRVLNGVKPEHLVDSYKNDSLPVVKFESGKYDLDANEYIRQTGLIKGISSNFENNEGVVFVMIYDIVDPEPKSLDEARGIITADYQNYLEKVWIKDLRKKYPVKVNSKVLSSIK